MSDARLLLSELQATIASMRKVLDSVDWSEKTLTRKPSVVIGMTIGKLHIVERISSALEAKLLHEAVEPTQRGTLAPVCEHCENSGFVTLYIRGDERLVGCRTCAPFSHSGAAA